MQAVTESKTTKKTGKREAPISSTKNSKPNERLARSYEALKKHLAELERENQKLALELERKRKERAERLKRERSDESRQRLNNLASRINQTGEIAKRQKQILAKLRSFYRKNEKLLHDIGGRLIRLEQAINKNEMPVETMRDELLGMLGELQEMRTKRERILSLGGSER